MFLTKKAEDAFNALLKQAKEILDKPEDADVAEVDETEEIDIKPNKFKEIVDLIKKREYNKAIDLTLKLDPATELGNFYSSPEFMELPEEERTNFIKDIGVNDRMETEIEKEVEKRVKDTEQGADSEENKAEDTSLDSLLGGAGSSEDGIVDTEGADLNAVSKPGEEGKTASIFDFLHKKAEEVELSETTDVKTYPLDESVKNMVRSYCSDGYSKQNAVEQALSDCNCPESDMHHYRQVAEDTANFSAVASQKSDLGTYNTKVEEFLKQASEYKPEGNEFDRICEISKSSATAYEFLNKVANKLEENSNKQYPGQKLFDDPKNVSFDGGFGESPKHPGQKVLSTKEGGNATVETNFPKAEKPQVDVYTDKVNRGKVTTINSLDGTIAFMQPLPFEKQVMGPTADYTGYVTGTKLEQFGKPDAAGPVAEAGHVTSNYLDKVFEVADKKKVSGNLPAHNASVKDGLSKKADSTEPGTVGLSNAGFNFHGVNKTATSNEAELKKKAIDAKQWIAEHEESNKLTEEEYKKAYESYLQSRENERKMLDARFPHSGNNSIPVDTYDEFKTWYGKPENVSYQLDANPEDYARSHPEFAHEYVFNAVQSGTDIKDLPTDIVEIAKKWEIDHNKEFPEVQDFGTIPVQTPNNLPVVDSENYLEYNAGFTFHGLTKNADAFNEDISQGTSGANDNFLGKTTNNQKADNKKLTPEELEEARKRAKEELSNIQRANGLAQSLVKSASNDSGLQKLEAYLEELKAASPEAYSKVMEAAFLNDDMNFQTTLTHELKMWLKPNNPLLDSELSNLPFSELKSKLNPQKETPKADKQDKNDKADAKKEDRATDESDGLSDLEELL